MFSSGRPRSTIRSRHASAAAPAPEVTTFTWSICLPTTFRPLMNAADTQIAVPCWSSWNTGIFIRSRSLRSTVKHSGALMSSRLIPPNVASRPAMISTSLSGSVSLISMSYTSRPANFLNSTALPSITGGRQRADIAQAQHRRAVGDHAHQIAARRVAEHIGRVGHDFLTGRRHAGRIGQRQVALVGQLLGGGDGDFAGAPELVIFEGGFAKIGIHGIGEKQVLVQERGNSIPTAAGAIWLRARAAPVRQPAPAGQPILPAARGPPLLRESE